IAQAGVKGIARQRPERQLNHIVIEFWRGEAEIVQTVDDQNCQQRARRADDPSCTGKNRGKGREYGELSSEIIGNVGANGAIKDLDSPPGEGWELVVAELPFAAVGECFDEIERKVRVERRRQDRPKREMHQGECREGLCRTLLDQRTEVIDQARRRHARSKYRKRWSRYHILLFTLLRPDCPSEHVGVFVRRLWMTIIKLHCGLPRLRCRCNNDAIAHVYPPHAKFLSTQWGPNSCTL